MVIQDCCCGSDSDFTSTEFEMGGREHAHIPLANHQMNYHYTSANGHAKSKVKNDFISICGILYGEF